MELQPFETYFFSSNDEPLKQWIGLMRKLLNKPL